MHIVGICALVKITTPITFLHKTIIKSNSLFFDLCGKVFDTWARERKNESRD